MLKTTFLLIACLAIAFAVHGNKGACKTENYKPVDIDWNRYLGKWYNVAVSDSFYYSDHSDKCTTADYSLNQDGTVKVDNRAVKKDGSKVQAIGTAKIVSPGHLSVKFSKFQPIGGNYEVVYINEDYTVATVVGCNGYFSFFGASDVWILVRDYNIDYKHVDQALKITSALGFDISDVQKAGTDACSGF